MEFQNICNEMVAPFFSAPPCRVNSNSRCSRSCVYVHGCGECSDIRWRDSRYQFCSLQIRVIVGIGPYIWFCLRKSVSTIYQLAIKALFAVAYWYYVVDDSYYLQCYGCKYIIKLTWLLADVVVVVKCESVALRICWLYKMEKVKPFDFDLSVLCDDKTGWALLSYSRLTANTVKLWCVCVLLTVDGE